MSTLKHRSANFKTIALTATIVASAAAIAALAMVDPPSDAAMPIVSFDVAPPVAVSPPDTAPPSTLLSSVSSQAVHPQAARPVNDPWSADESSRGTRPDAMH